MLDSVASWYQVRLRVSTEGFVSKSWAQVITAAQENMGRNILKSTNQGTVAGKALIERKGVLVWLKEFFAEYQIMIIGITVIGVLFIAYWLIIYRLLANKGNQNL